LGAASFFAGAFVLQKVPYRKVAGLDPAFCQRAAKLFCDPVQRLEGDDAVLGDIADRLIVHLELVAARRLARQGVVVLRLR
jgi:hypothetical protein